MLERGIIESQIEVTLSNPDLTYPSLNGGKTLLKKFEDNRILKVWILERQFLESSAIIKSVAWEGESK